MNTDCYFGIGSTHKICQDYAIAANGLIIVSDGCSTAVHSDFGSRLLTKAAEDHVYRGYRDDLMLHGVIRTAEVFCKSLSLPVEALSATLLIGKIENNCFSILCVGDGVIAAQHRSGELFIYDYKYVSGAPYYLRYELEENVKESYLNKFGGEVIQTTYVIAVNGHVSKYIEKRDISKYIKKDIYEQWEQPFFKETFPLDDFESIALFSDGVCSFVRQELTETSKQNIEVPVYEVIKELYNFKGYNGAFVQRRCQKALRAMKNTQHIDDFSMAVIHV